MMRTLQFLILVSTLFLFACSGEGDAPKVTAEPEAETAQTESWRADRLQLGKQIYEEACASCHDSGEGGAPVTGKESDWSDRSGLWVAVLSDHASAGYLEMPGKGGRTDLSDKTVDAAVEFMMQKTYPELPRD